MFVVIDVFQRNVQTTHQRKHRHVRNKKKMDEIDKLLQAARNGDLEEVGLIIDIKGYHADSKKEVNNFLSLFLSLSFLIS